MVPLAGSWNASGISITMSELDLPTGREGQRRLEACPWASPSGAPLSDPRRNNVDLLPQAQAAVVREVPVPPGSANHGGIFLADHGGLERLGPRDASEYVSSDIGADFAGALMAFLAVLLQDRQDVLIKPVTLFEAANLTATPRKQPAMEGC